MNLGPIAKAVVAALVAGVAPYTAALQPTSQAGGHVTLGEWATVVVAVLVGARLVWTADNVRWFKYAKATSAAVVTFLGPLVVILLAGRTPTTTDVLNALVQVVIAFGVVSQVPNADESEWHDPAGEDGEDDPDEPAGPEAVAAAEPLDEDGDGRDDNTGRYLPGNPGRVHVADGMRPNDSYPNLTSWNATTGTADSRALALILGGARVDPVGGVGVRA